MDRNAGLKQAIEYLYPPITPFDQQIMDVGDGHKIYVEQSGQRDGVPVLVLHGGPGGGCSTVMRRYFDPSVYRIIMFDQRGCGRSHPYASIEKNTTWHLVSDIESIRAALKIERFILFGGSWGATLALIYAISHPESVMSLVLRGIFLMTKDELGWFYGGGAGRFFPEQWKKFEAPIPEDERYDLIRAYHRRLFSGNPSEELHYASSWTILENKLASIYTDLSADTPPLGHYAHAFARLENHYFYHNGFLEYDGWILRNRHLIEHIPAHIIQGRYDMVCPPISAYKLADGWRSADLEMIPLAGHALSESGISESLVRKMDMLRS